MHREGAHLSHLGFYLITYTFWECPEGTSVQTLILKLAYQWPDFLMLSVQVFYAHPSLPMHTILSVEYIDESDSNCTLYFS